MTNATYFDAALLPEDRAAAKTQDHALVLTVDQVLTDLHDSEINGRVSWFYDGAWRVVLGDPMNGWDAGSNVGSIAEATQWLVDEAVWLYPESLFARKYEHLVSDEMRQRIRAAVEADRTEEGEEPPEPVEEYEDDLAAEDGVQSHDYIEIVLNQPPGPESDFVEALDSDGQPLIGAKWKRRRDGLWAFRIPVEIADESEPETVEQVGFV